LKYDLLVKDAMVVIPYYGVCASDIGIFDGKVSAVGLNLDSKKADSVIDAKGKYVFPGAIDTHTHFGISLPFYEDFENESAAAARGGATTFLSLLKVDDFAEGSPSYEVIFTDIIERLKEKSTVDYSFHFQIPSLSHADKVPLYYHKLGIQSFKVYMVYKDRKKAPGVDDGIILYLLKIAGRMEKKPLIMIHAECEEIIRLTTEEVKNRGLEGLKAWNAARPSISEAHGIIRTCYMARAADAPIYIVHVSTVEGLNIIEREKWMGTEVIAETCPQYLVLNEDMKGNLGKINPPIRKKEDVEALWEGIKKGTITCIGTDHGSKLIKMKQGSIWEASLGFPGIGTMFPLILSEGMKRGLSLVKIAEICSSNNARTFGMFPRKGTICIGSDADLVVVDLERSWMINPKILYELSDFTPYDGIEVKGYPLITILRGNVIFEKGEILLKGKGEFIPRFP
jgi:dihydropyrimidinase